MWEAKLTGYRLSDREDVYEKALDLEVLLEKEYNNAYHCNIIPLQHEKERDEILEIFVGANREKLFFMFLVRPEDLDIQIFADSFRHIIKHVSTDLKAYTELIKNNLPPNYYLYSIGQKSQLFKN